MSHRTRPRTLWTVVLSFSMIAALFAAIGSTPAAAQTGPSITPIGSQSHDVDHRACTRLEASAPVDDWEVENGDLLPPGVRVDAEFGIPTRGRLGGIPTQPGNYTFRIRAVNDDLGAGPWLTIVYNVFTPDASVPIIKAGRLDQAFTIDCFSQGSVANEFLSNPANFGPSGRVRLPSGLPIHEHTDGFDGRPTRITADYLADADILFDGFVGENSYSRREIGLIRRWVERDGGVLIAAEDNQFSDRLGEIFGAPTEGFIVPANDTNDGDPWLHCDNPGDIPNADDIPGQPTCPRLRPAGSGSHPIARGPFGPWSRIWTDGTVGYLAPGFDRAWKRVATHPNGRAAIIERKIGNGHVIILSDEGTIRTNLDGDNGLFLGNLFAFAIGQVSEVPRADNDVIGARIFNPFRANLCRNDEIPDGVRRVRITRGTLPPGLRLNKRTCVVSGNPGSSSLGTYGITYQVRDRDGGDTDTAKAQITLNGNFGPAPGIPADSNPNCNGRPATLVGTSGPDVIRGTRGADVIVGNGGKDIIRGLGGNDIICGGGGRDRIIGGPGRDTCFGQKGKDRIRGCEVRRP